MNNSISVQFNEAHVIVGHNTTLTNFIALQGIENTHFIVAINDEIIPKSHYETTFLSDGDLIELVSPISGG